MSAKPVVLRERARLDIDEAIAHYVDEASAEVASGFIEALEAALRGIGDYPASGSPRYAAELDIPGLRSRQVTGFPFLIFYVERPANIDAWRVLHAARDIPVWLQEPVED